jgi:hypothetical protein
LCQRLSNTEEMILKWPVRFCWLVIAWHDFDVLEARFLSIRSLRLVAHLKSTDFCAFLCFLSWQNSSKMTCIVSGTNEWSISWFVLCWIYNSYLNHQDALQLFYFK